ncbi:acylneuraminate cytidylyltransferase, partial [Desulfovibrio oxamicus]|nr:acylneuraminate cytidylyltransferase [Nitratidesulfovibrio oxamicus]
VLSAPGVPSRRQDLPGVLCRDGALTLLRVGGRTTRSTTEVAADGVPGPHDSSPCESGVLPYRPIPIGRAQATLVASRLDAARGMALAAHDGHPDITAQAATGNTP